MVYNSPFADANAHGSSANAFTWQRTPRGSRLIKKPVARNDNSPLQDQNRALFKTAVASVQSVRDDLNSILPSPVSGIKKPRWASFVKNDRLDIQFATLFLGSVTFHFKWQNDEWRPKRYDPLGVCLLGREAFSKNWLCFGGNILGSPEQFAWNRRADAIDRLLFLYGHDCSHKIQTIVCLDMYNSFVDDWQEVRITFPHEAKHRTRYYALNWLFSFMYPVLNYYPVFAYTLA